MLQLIHSFPLNSISQSFVCCIVVKIIIFILILSLSCLTTFAILTSVLVKIPVFGYVTPFRVSYGYQRFAGACSLHLHGGHPKDGVSKLRLNFDTCIPIFTVLHSRRPEVSFTQFILPAFSAIPTPLDCIKPAHSINIL